MTYSATKFEVATVTCNGLGGDTFTRNVTGDGRTDGRIDGRRTNFGTKLIYPFSNEKSGKIKIYKRVRQAHVWEC